MYKNGYYLEKNIDIAKSIYYSLYDTVISEFYKEPKNSSLADVSLRIASLSDNDKEYKYAYNLYLQALCAINLRKSKFDSTVRRTIINNIKRLYNEHSDEFNKMGLDVTLNSFYNYSISIDGNTLKFKSPSKQIIHIYPEMYCTYSKELNVKIDGEVIGKIKKNEIVDSFEEKDNVYTFYNEVGRIIAKIRINSYKAIIKKRIISNEEDDNVYKIAICQYSKGIGKEYQFLYEGDESIDGDWIIVETGQDVYPKEFLNLKGYELNCDTKYMKHIRKK